MYNRKIPHQQLTAWLAAAIIPTAIQLTAGASWFSVLLASLLCLMCVGVRWGFGTEPRGVLIAVIQWLLLVLILGTVCRASVQSWPEGAHPVVALVLLALALWSTWKGTSAAARVGCALFWFVLVLYLILLGAGMKDVQIPWLKPTQGGVESLGCILLLTPAAAVLHLNKRERIKSRLILPGLLCTVAAVITAGVLSPQIAAVRSNAFYEMTRSLNLLGQARRFEAVVSAGMTVGWFCLFSLYLTLCTEYAESVRPGLGRCGSILAAVAASTILLCDLHIPGILLLVFSAVFWVLLPLMTQGIDKIKKS